MSEAPERIIVAKDFDGLFVCRAEIPGSHPYIRADIAECELAEARADVERINSLYGFEQRGRLTAEAERDRLAAELRNDQAELKRLMRAVPGAHFCQDWDGLLVWPGTPEADACTCASLQTGEKEG